MLFRSRMALRDRQVGIACSRRTEHLDLGQAQVVLTCQLHSNISALCSRSARRDRGGGAGGRGLVIAPCSRPALQGAGRVVGQEGGIGNEDPVIRQARGLQQSVRFQTTTEVTVAELPKSTCHQAFWSLLVVETEWS